MNSVLTFLGKDSGFGDENNSAYIEKNDKFILIDCGFTVFEKLKKIDFNKYKNIEIIITHLHNDHAGSLSQFILYLWFKYNKKTTVYCNCKYIKEYLEITGTTPEAYEIKKSAPNIEFIKTEHAKELDAYGFKMKILGKNIVYTGDTKTLEPYIPYLNDCDELYVDVSKNGGVHLKFEDIIPQLKELKENNTKVFLMHIDDKEYIKNLNNDMFYI